MASDFPLYLGSDQSPGEVVDFTPGSSETFAAGALVYYDTGDQRLKKCGADPALIMGIALVPKTASTIYANGKVPVLVLRPDMTICMSGAETPAETMVGVLYDILEAASGNWRKDSTTGATRLIVTRVDITNGIFYVKFIAANLQFDAIAS